MSFDSVLEKFPDAKRAGSGWLVRCPAHDDGKASLSIGEGEDGRVLLKCHAGCAVDAIVAAVGLEMKDLMPEKELEPVGRKVITKTYDYCDEAGSLVFQVVRYYPKDFRQRKPDGKGGWNWSVKGIRALPYNLKAIIDAPDRAVAVVEGEKDVESLAKIGVLATCNAGGAGKWTKEHAKFLVGRSVVVLPDKDQPGEKHASVVCESLDGLATAIRVVRLPDLPAKGDVSDWVLAGGTKEALRDLASKTPLWERAETAPAATMDPAEESGVRRTSLQDAAENYLRKLAQGRETLIDTGIPLLDYSLGGGVTYGEMVIVAARPSHGKSAIGLQMAHAMSQSGLPVVLVSEEMSALAVGKRAVQFVSNTPEEHWKDQMHIVQEEVYEHFRARADITIIESCGSVERACAEIEALHADGKCKVAVVDYAQLLDAKGRDARERVSLVSKTLKLLAGRLQIVVIVLAQLNREIESRKPYTPKMSDIKETGQLEQDADVIIFGVWPHRIDSSVDKRKYQFYVGKNRNRAINEAAFEVEFLPSRQKLVDAKPEPKSVKIGHVTFAHDFDKHRGQGSYE